MEEIFSFISDCGLARGKMHAEVKVFADRVEIKRDKVKGLKYKITKSSASNGTVTVIENLKKDATKITIPSTVKIKGYTFKVKGINKRVFQKCKKLRKVKIGVYVTNIGSRCFYKCSNLTSVIFSGKKAPKIENQAFKKTRAKAKRTKAMSNKQFNLLKKRVNNAKW